MTEVWIYEVITLGGPLGEGRVLKTGSITQDLATREHAKDLLQEQCNGPSYRIKPGLKRRPEGIRFIDQQGQEKLLYTIMDLRADGGTVAPNEDSAD